MNQTLANNHLRPNYHPLPNRPPRLRLSPMKGEGLFSPLPLRERGRGRGGNLTFPCERGVGREEAFLPSPLAGEGSGERGGK